MSLWNAAKSGDGGSAAAAAAGAGQPSSCSPPPSPTSQPLLGMTPPISLAPPDPQDYDRTRALTACLQPHDVFETECGMNQRLAVLSRLNSLVKTWIRDVSLEKNMPANLAAHVGGHVYTFGSYRLGVHNKGADIDALCVAPRHILREDYFGTFFELLKGQPEVSDLRAVPEAFVPVIKMKFSDIEIDMTFARLALKEVTDQQKLSDPQLLKNLDPKCVRSLNGCRVTDEILRQVPNRDTFRLTLRTIKLWAKRHGIYSNVLGYLGGVSWAMLVARVCQLYPHADASTLVQKFFLVFLKWQWPQPVLLKRPEDPGLGFSVWDPRQNVADRYHLMPIITPAYPQQNSTFNVSRSTLEVMKKEFQLSLSICEEIFSGKATWDKLFETPNFFGKYKHFIVLEASSFCEEDQLEWQGLVESKVRHLVGNLEREAIELAHVWPKTYPSLEAGREKTCCYWFVGLVIKTASGSEQKQNLDLTTPIKKFTELVMGTAITIKVWKDGMRVEADYKRRKMLANYLPPEERHKLKSDRSKMPVTVVGAPSASVTLKTTTTVTSDAAPALPGEETQDSSKDAHMKRPSSESLECRNGGDATSLMETEAVTVPDTVQSGVGDGASSSSTTTTTTTTTTTSPAEPAVVVVSEDDGTPAKRPKGTEKSEIANGVQVS